MKEIVRESSGLDVYFTIFPESSSWRTSKELWGILTRQFKDSSSVLRKGDVISRCVHMYLQTSKASHLPVKDSNGEEANQRQRPHPGNSTIDATQQAPHSLPLYSDSFANPDGRNSTSHGLDDARKDKDGTGGFPSTPSKSAGPSDMISMLKEENEKLQKKIHELQSSTQQDTIPDWRSNSLRSHSTLTIDQLEDSFKNDSTFPLSINATNVRSSLNGTWNDPRTRAVRIREHLREHARIARSNAASILDVMAGLDAANDTVRDEVNGVRQTVLNSCAQLHRLVEKKKDMLLDQLDKEEETKLKYIDASRNICSNRLQKVQECLNLVEQVLAQDIVDDFIQHAESLQLQRKLKEVSKLTVPDSALDATGVTLGITFECEEAKSSVSELQLVFQEAPDPPSDLVAKDVTVTSSGMDLKVSMCSRGLYLLGFFCPPSVECNQRIFALHPADVHRGSVPQPRLGIDEALP
mmetsp:Transcript_19170/g.63293  ORF Transcript_19170/g.63293 Transcript_19170/m.63293 type:complete len:467 (-) Transcript_19170:800-2200(-)